MVAFFSHRAVAKLIFILFVFVFSIILLIIDYNFLWQNDKYNFSQKSGIHFYKNLGNHEPRILFDHCNLTDLDPWDPMIRKWLYPIPIPDPMKNCKVQVKQISKIVNGQLFIDLDERKNATCLFRCLYPNGDWQIIFGEWVKVKNGIQPQCDVIEVECQDSNNKNGTMETFYKFLHAQIYRSEFPENRVEAISKKPDVHIILFDSVSHTQFIRSMPKTLHMLREHYKAIGFRHLNKMGLNSTPNGFALLIGKNINNIPKSPVSRGHKADYNDTIGYCNYPLDDDQFIGFRFQDDGYVTMMVEDWTVGVFNYPNCKGFAKTPTTHYMRPFQARLGGNKGYRSLELRKTMYSDICKESFEFEIEYLKNFIDAYPDKPKFSVTWMTNLAHESRNNLYHTDDYFYDFLKSNKEKLNNSFVIVLGDHGKRFSGLSNSAMGEIEDKNPLFFMSIPASMRQDYQLINNLKHNSHQLMTHYDIYATLLEITNPSNPRHPNPLIRGSSLFHPLPQPRTCDHLGIPFRFCMCDFKKKLLPKDNEVGNASIKLILERMNQNLKEFNDTAECSLLTLNSDAKLEVLEFEEKGEVKIYQIKWNTLPGNGSFSGFITQNIQNGSITIHGGIKVKFKWK